MALTITRTKRSASAKDLGKLLNGGSKSVSLKTHYTLNTNERAYLKKLESAAIQLYPARKIGGARS